MEPHNGQERRINRLSDEEFERIVEASAKRNEEKFTLYVGRTVISGFLRILGAVALAAAAWFHGHLSK